MDAAPFTLSQQKALGQLLDDPAPAVRSALRSIFAAQSRASTQLLRDLARSPDRVLAGHAARYLHELNLPEPVEEFRQFIRSLNYELETGAILLSRTVNAELDVGACCLQLDEMAARGRELLTEPATARQKCRLLNRVLFHEYGLRGNAEHYTDPLNSFIDQVLIRRKGLPISLSIVYLLVAERMGLALEPVGLPGHFLVGCYAEVVPFFIDPFHGGRLLSVDDVIGLARPDGGPVEFGELAPTPVREVLCRCCRNLAHHYTAAELPDHANLFAGFVADFESTHERHARP